MENTKENVSGKRAKKSRKKKPEQEMLAWIRELLLAFLIVLVIKLFLFEIITVDGRSMLETLQHGDKLYVSLLTPKIQGYERGDVVICYYPGRKERCVKRIIGMPGDTVEIRQGTVYVNGERLEEDYITYAAGYSYPSTTLKEDEYFVLGDNRLISHDSHSSDVGAVTRIEGKVRFVLWPISRFGAVE